MPDITNTFDSNEELAAITVDVSGAETATLTETDYGETDNGDGTFTYNATYSATADGDYTFTLTQAEDKAGNDGASGQSVTVSTSATIDGFEDGDISEYSVDTASYTTQQTTVESGSFALQGSTGSAGEPKTIISNSGLDNYPTPGDTFEFYFQFPSLDSENGNLLFATQNLNNVPDGYNIQLDAVAGRLRVNKVESGSVTILAEDSSATYEANAWMRGEVTWTSNNELSCIIEDSSGTQTGSTGTTTDSTYTSGGFGWRTNTTASAVENIYWDSARLL